MVLFTFNTYYIMSILNYNYIETYKLHYNLAKK